LRIVRAVRRFHVANHIAAMCRYEPTSVRRFWGEPA
jgi:hypothetical protein